MSKEKTEIGTDSLQTIQIRFDGNSRRRVFEKSADVTRRSKRRDVKGTEEGSDVSLSDSDNGGGIGVLRVPISRTQRVPRCSGDVLTGGEERLAGRIARFLRQCFRCGAGRTHSNVVDFTSDRSLCVCQMMKSSH